MKLPAKNIHVVHLIGSTGLYGAERWILAQMRGLDTDKVKATLINLVDKKDEASEIVAAAQMRGLSALDYFTGGRFNLLSAVRMSRRLKRHGVTIVHGHGFKSDAFGLLAGRLAGCKVMSTPHGWSIEKDRKLQLYEQFDRFLFKFMDRVCPLSPALFEGLSKSKKATNLRLILNSVDIDEIRSISRAGDALSDDFVIGYIGRLVPLKNLETLLQALHILKVDGVKFKLQIIGDGLERERLQNLALNLTVDAQSDFLGYRDNAVSYLKDFDVFVLPSLSEGIPRCIMEAMAAGVPVVASDIPGNRALVSDGETGFLFKSGDSAELAAKIKQMINSPDKAKTMAEAARQKIEADYSNRRMAQEYTALYYEMIGS